MEYHSPCDFIIELANVTMGHARNRLEITADADENVPDIFFFDRSLLELAIMNGVYNCLKYAKTNIHFGLGMDDGMLKISISDDSGGFPSQILECNIDEMKPTKGGTGLGLHFASLIAQAHKAPGKSGFLRLRNEDNRAFFEIFIP